MFSSIVWPSWSELFHGEVTFKHIGEIISGMFTELVEHEYFAELNGAISSAIQGFVLPVFAVFAMLSVIFALFGRKLLPLAKVTGFFIIGFLFGVSYIAPFIIGASFNVMPWIIGGVVGIVAALLSKPLYPVLYIVSFAYASYMIFMGGQLLPESIVGFTRDNMIIALFAVCITIVLVFLLRKPIEVIGTGILGGYLFSLCIDKILYLAFGVERIAALSIILMIVVAFLGVVKQFKSKRAPKSKKKK